MEQIEKIQRLLAASDERAALWEKPVLLQLFFELTDACNLACLHCGSRCDSGKRTYLSYEDIVKVLDNVAENTDPSQVMINITGGEPLMHPDFKKIVSTIHEKGFPWGMTTNATLIDDDMADWLYDVAHMYSVSVSLDGLPEQHDWLRSRPGSYEKAVAGIKSLQRHFPVMITTVFGKHNIGSFDEMRQIATDLNASPWRAINIDPIGRALEHPEIMLSNEEIGQLVKKIAAAHDEGMDVEYGCAHYLFPDNEFTVRPWAFMCLAGITVASIRANGNIVACLDIEDRPETVQGNIAADGFWDTWMNGYEVFRKPLWSRCEMCRGCDDRYVCDADAYHTFDWDRMEPRVCAKRMFPDTQETA